MDEQDTEMECDMVFILTISSLSQCSISKSDRHKYSKHQDAQITATSAQVKKQREKSEFLFKQNMVENKAFVRSHLWMKVMTANVSY